MERSIVDNEGKRPVAFPYLVPDDLENDGLGQLPWLESNGVSHVLVVGARPGRVRERGVIDVEGLGQKEPKPVVPRPSLAVNP